MCPEKIGTRKDSNQDLQLPGKQKGTRNKDEIRPSAGSGKMWNRGRRCRQQGSVQKENCGGKGSF